MDKPLGFYPEIPGSNPGEGTMKIIPRMRDKVFGHRRMRRAEHFRQWRESAGSGPSDNPKRSEGESWRGHQGVLLTQLIPIHPTMPQTGGGFVGEQPAQGDKAET